jgi:hypothetical protein
MVRSTKNAVLLFFVGVGVIISGVAAFAQDVPGDYQDVLKLLDRKGDFKAGVLKVNISTQIRSRIQDHGGTRRPRDEGARGGD